MINKEVVKLYADNKCYRFAYFMLHEKEAFKILLHLLEAGYQEEEIEEITNGSEEFKDSLIELIHLYPEAYNEVIKNMAAVGESDLAANLIAEMKDFQEVSRQSRNYFEQLYPGKVRRADTLDGSLDGFEDRVSKRIEERTQQYLSDPEIKVILEGQITKNKMVARWDSLVRTPTGFDLYEVKGTTNIGGASTQENNDTDPTSLKKIYLYDIAFQYEVYLQAGLPIDKVNFLILNKEFRLSKTEMSYPIDLAYVNNLFVPIGYILNHKKRIALKDYLDKRMYVKRDNVSIEQLITNLLTLQMRLKTPSPQMIYKCRNCPLVGDCFGTIDHHHILKLTCSNLIGGNYHNVKRYIEEEAITTIQNIPDESVEQDYPLTKNGKKLVARMQIDYEKGDLSKPNCLEPQKIRELLRQEYCIDPLIFFDFETFSYPLPLVENCGPYESVCCQYSMHVMTRDYDLKQHDFTQGKGGGITHYEYIGRPSQDRFNNPERNLIKTLKEQFQLMGIDPMGGHFTLVVYNKSFEKTQFKRMAEKYREESEFLMICYSRIVDLLDFFRYGYWYRQDFHGKLSLKVTQPMILKDHQVINWFDDFPYNIKSTLNYKSGIIQNGEMALEVYQSLLRKMHQYHHVLEEDDLLRALLAYCKIDSWGTVVLYDIIAKVGARSYDGTLDLEVELNNFVKEEALLHS